MVLKVLILLYCLSLSENVVSTESAISEKVAPLSTNNSSVTVSSTAIPPNANVTDSSVSENATTTVIKTVPLPSLAPEIKIPASNRPANESNDNGPNFEWAGIDINDEERNKTLIQGNITSIDEDYHDYYNSTITQNENFTGLHRESVYSQCSNLTVNMLLSKSHRRAMTVKLPFEFPFYGHFITNITIATGGFLYAGDYIHSWLAATQYISPLMANFDTSLSNDSFVKYCEDANSFHVFWERVLLQNKSDIGSFTFSASLFKDGDIFFAYYMLPISIATIDDDKHPVKVGVSDAYIIDKTVFHARRKTIFEYHRVNFPGPDIRNYTTIRLTPLPTCLSFTDCQSCLENEIKFSCSWCPSLKRCSSGVDRKRQEWSNHGCDKSKIQDTKNCAALDTNNNSDVTTQNTLSSDASPTALENKRSHDSTHPDTKKSNAGFITSVCTIMALVLVAICWVFYAYTHPHTSSGQFLIQYGRPAAWSWRRGEARYTAATIHM